MSGILGFIILLLDILAIVQIVNSRLHTDKKIFWTAIIILLPILGLILWHLVGKR